MQIKNHRLYDKNGDPVPYQRTPNHGTIMTDTAGRERQVRKQITPLFIVLHYTAGSNFEGACNWLTNPRARASAHFVLDRDGKGLKQLLPTNERAWHAGVSEWGEFKGLNDFSIGIEMINVGYMIGRVQGGWLATNQEIVPEDQVVELPHPHTNELKGWQMYTQEQWFACLEICQTLIDKYPTIRDILAHHQISPGRKSDVGPAFAIEHFRGRLFGRM